MKEILFCWFGCLFGCPEKRKEKKKGEENFLICFLVIWELWENPIFVKRLIMPNNRPFCLFCLFAEKVEEKQKEQGIRRRREIMLEFQNPVMKGLE